MTIITAMVADARLYLRLRSPKSSRNVLQYIRIWCNSPGLWVLTAHRIAHYYTYMANMPSGFPLSMQKIWLGTALTLGRYLSMVMKKCELRASTNVAPGVFLSNYGHMVLGARSIGSGTIIHDHVTMGMGLPGNEVPEIGRDVWIGPDCIVYGGISVGDGATLLPGTVLTKSIPPKSVVQGNPARIIKLAFDNSKLRESMSICHEQFPLVANAAN